MAGNSGDMGRSIVSSGTPQPPFAGTGAVLAAVASPSASADGSDGVSLRFPISPSQLLTRFSYASILAARSQSHGADTATSVSRNRSTKPRNQPLDSSPSRFASSPLSSAPPPLSHSGGAGVVVSAAAAAAVTVLAFPFAGDSRDFGDGDDFVAVAAAAAGFADSSTTTTASGEETVAGAGLRL